MTIHLNDLQTFGLEMRAMLTAMEEAYPFYPPTPNDSHELIMYRAGQQDVIAWIRNYLDKDGQEN